MRDEEYLGIGISAADIVRERCPVSAVSAVSAALESSAANHALNAFVTVDGHGAIGRARAIDAHPDAALTLRGVTLAVKDNIHVCGLPNTAGTEILRTFMPPDTSPVVDVLQKLGAIVLGKAGMHELAYGITSTNYTFGAVRNPVDPAKTPGGSSGGTAAAVAAGIVTAGLGTDTGGSVRIPAALTGTVGFRPSVGSYSSDGVTLISHTRDTIGVIARTVLDAAILHNLIVGAAPITPRDVRTLRVGIPHKYFCENLDEEVARVFQDFCVRLSRAGAQLIEADLDDVPDLNQAISFSVCLYETAQLLPAYLARYQIDATIDQLVDGIKSPDVANILQQAMGGSVDHTTYEQALRVDRPRLQAAYARYFAVNRVDVVAFPTTPITARDIDGLIDGVVVNGRTQDTFETYIRNTDPASNAGIPAISIPAGTTSDGLPVGIELECHAGADRALLEIALGIEAALSAIIL